MIQGLYYVDPLQVSVEIGADPIFKTARFFIGGNSYRDYEIMRVLRNTRDGVTGVGVVAESQIQLETMFNALKYENRMVRTGAKKGFLKVEPGKKVTQAILDQLRSSWRKMYGSDSEETTVILNDGVDFKDAGQTAVETQLNENKETNGHEIYKIFSCAHCPGGRCQCGRSEEYSAFCHSAGGQGPAVGNQPVLPAGEREGVSGI